MLERMGNAVADKYALRGRSPGKTPLLEEGLGRQSVRAVSKQGNASGLHCAQWLATVRTAISWY